MDKTNKFYKILRIVFLTLAIISLVFTLCKKVGLCASSDPVSQVTSLPLPYGPGSNIGYSTFPLTQDIIDNCVSLALSYKPTYYQNGWSALVYEVNSDYIVLSICGGQVLSIPDSYSSFPVLDTTSSFKFSRDGVVRVKYTISSGVYDITYTGSSSSTYLCSVGKHVSALPTGGYYVLKNTFISAYPVAFSEGYNLSVDSSLVFDNSSYTDSNYESIEGTVSDIFNYTEIISGVAEDMTTPSLFGRLYQWLLGIQQTIYGGFNNIWQNFRSLFKPMIDNISNFFQWFHDKYTEFFNFIYDKWLELFDALGLSRNQTLTDFLDYLELIYNFLTGQGNVTLQDVIEGALDGLFGNNGKLAHIKEIFDWFYTHGLKNGEFDFVTLWDYLFEYDEQVVYSQLKTSRYGAFVLSCKTEMTSFFTALTSVTAADHVQFTIPIGTTLGGVEIPDIVIDFDWYADIRDTFLPWFMAFLYVTVIWCFWKSLPNIIHGVAGDVSTFTDALGGDEFAPTSHGIFTQGVSHNQPSLDKAPLSGGGGVHSGASQFWY